MSKLVWQKRLIPELQFLQDVRISIGTSSDFLNCFDIRILMRFDALDTIFFPFFVLRFGKRFFEIACFVVK